VPRPKLPEGKKKTDSVHVRLREDERKVFDALTERLQANELRGVTLTDASVVRWLVAKAAEERGIKPQKVPPPSKTKARSSAR
jgi:hypothetical protein